MRELVRGARILALAAALPAALPAQEASAPKRPWNELSTSWVDLQLHITAMLDGAFFSQDAASKQQVGNLPDLGRFRLDNFEVDGQLEAPFPWSFQVEAEYDGMDQSNGQRGWTLSGLNVTVPVGKLFSVTVGNQSEGVTMERLSNSYDLVFMERSTMSSALTTPRQNGVRVKGTAAGGRLNWSAGWYNGWLTNDLSFSESGNIFNGRVAGLPVDANGGRRLLHLGAWGGYSEAQQGSARTRSRPEVYEAPFFVDTGSFSADSTSFVGLELAAVEGPVTLAAEYTGSRSNAPAVGDPRFSAYYVQASWAITGETRPYGRACGCFGELEPSVPFSFKQGGTGAIEVGARYSNIDLTSGGIDGGTFERWGGAASWFPTTEWRLEFNYGYGTLRRSGLTGRTHFYQLRLQWEM